MSEAGQLDETLLRALGREVLRVSSRRGRVVPGAALEASAFRILWRLDEEGPLTLRQLAEQLQLDLSTVNRQVRHAVDRGWVERRRVEGGTSLAVLPTPTGRAAYDADAHRYAIALTEALAELGEERTQEMLASLRTFNDALDRALAPQG